MAEAYVRLQEESKLIEVKITQAHETLMRYFKATGTENIETNGSQIVHSFMMRTDLDRDYLFSELGDRFMSIAVPQDRLIKQAIKEGTIDPELYERAKRVRYIDQIKVKKAKGGNHADQESK